MLYSIVIKFEELLTFSIKITIPKSLREERKSPFGDLPLEKIVTESFSDLDMSSIKLKESLSEFLDEIPHLEFRGEDGMFSLRKSAIIFSLRRMFKEKKNDDKPSFTSKKRSAIDRDVTFLFSTFLGKLSLSDKKVQTTISIRFRRTDIFPKKIIEKFDKEFIKDANIQEIKEITFQKKETMGKVPVDIEFNFYRGDETEGAGVEMKYEDVFSPISLEKILELSSNKLDEFSKHCR